jgi:hypothetical protein
VDLPLKGRSFTRYKGDGHTMSRLDKFLVSVSWLESLSSFTQWGLQRGLSDHFLILLRDRVVDWGN